MDLKRFGCRIDPFAEVPDRQSFYCDALRRRISEEIISSIGRTAGFVMLTGEAGSGKTAMLHCLSEAIEARADCYILSSMPWLTCRQGTSLRDLAEAFSYARWVARLHDVESETHFGAALAARHRPGIVRGPEDEPIAVVMLDDAHRLAPQVVVQLRRWRTAFQSVRGPLSIIMTTCSEEGVVDAGVTAMSPENAGSGDVLMRLRPFERSDVQHLIHHRLRAAGYMGAMLFPPEAITRIFTHAKGNPSRTTRLCRRALALASKDSGGVSIAMIDAAAQMEFRPQPSPAIDAPLLQTFAATPSRLSGLPPAPDIPKAIFAGADAPGRSIIFGGRSALLARTLRLASATTSVVTVLAVGWLYAAGRDAVMHPVAAFETTVAAGMSAATALVQPARDQLRRDRRAPESSVDAAPLVEVLQPADAELELSAWDQSENAAQQQAAEMGIQQQAAKTGMQQQAANTHKEPMAADPASPEAEAEMTPSAPALALFATGSLETVAIDVGQISVAREGLSGFTGPDVHELLDRGNSLLELGDVASARLFYALASERGSAEGAMLMGLTFDPVYFERKGIYGTRPQAFEAIGWYRKSASMGNVLATERMRALELRLRQTARESD